MHSKTILRNMEPVFMYWNDVKYVGDNDFKKFKLQFNDSDKFNGVIFKKDRDYFITSLSTNVKINKNVKNLDDFEKISEVSKKANEILTNGVDHFHEDFTLEADLVGVNDLTPDKTKRKLSVKSFNFFDEKTEKKRMCPFTHNTRNYNFSDLNF